MKERRHSSYGTLVRHTRSKIIHRWIAREPAQTHHMYMADKAQCERGTVKTAKELGIRALPSDTRFECNVHDVLRWDNATAEMQPDISIEWRSQEIIGGKRFVLPDDSRRLYFEMQSRSSAA
jgi:hypothetical protein